MLLEQHEHKHASAAGEGAQESAADTAAATAAVSAAAHVQSTGADSPQPQSAAHHRQQLQPLHQQQ